ncbi:MAG: GGDEF domain-containing protein [Microgenomates group bacterium]
MSDKLIDIKNTLRNYFSQNGDDGDKRSWAELRNDSTRDGLTGLYNRGYFIEKFPVFFAKCKADNNKLALVMIDIDKFKNINDTYGHVGGDNTLIKFAEILKDKFPEREENISFVARYGGEEIVIVTTCSDETSFVQRVNRIKDELHQKHSNSSYHDEGGNKKYIEYTASFGITFLNDIDTAPDMLIKRADSALYKAKQGGRNRVEVA